MMDKDQKIIELESHYRAFRDALKNCAHVLEEEGYHALSSQIRELLRLRAGWDDIDDCEAVDIEEDRYET